MLWQLFGLPPLLELVIDMATIFMVFAILIYLLYIRITKINPWGKIIDARRMAIVVGRDRIARIFPIKSVDGMLFEVEGLDNPPVLLHPRNLYPVKGVKKPVQLAIIYMPQAIVQDIELLAGATKMNQELERELKVQYFDEKGEVREDFIKVIRERMARLSKEGVKLDKPVVVKPESIQLFHQLDYNPKYIREIQASASIGFYQKIYGMLRVWGVLVPIVMIGLIVLAAMGLVM